MFLGALPGTANRVLSPINVSLISISHPVAPGVSSKNTVTKVGVVILCKILHPNGAETMKNCCNDKTAICLDGWCKFEWSKRANQI